MPYFLVLLHPLAGTRDVPDHEPFIDSLVARNLVLLGGDLEPSAFGASAAYLLSCHSVADARDLAASDPLVSSGAMRADVVEWQLVGINPDAVESELVVRPEDIVR